MRTTIAETVTLKIPIIELKTALKLKEILKSAELLDAQEVILNIIVKFAK